MGSSQVATTSSRAGVGALVPDGRQWGLDYALPALFLALLVAQLRSRRQIGVALCSGGLALGLSAMGLGQWAVLLAAIAGATLGVLWEQCTKSRSA